MRGRTVIAGYRTPKRQGSHDPSDLLRRPPSPAGGEGSRLFGPTALPSDRARATTPSNEREAQLGQEDSSITLVREGRVALVTIRRGDRLNALSRDVMSQLTAIAVELRGDTSTSAVVLSGDPVFSAGADLSDRRLGAGADVPLIERREALRIGP